MNRKTFQDYLRNQVMILDGAFGTELQKRGMPPGVCPEQWALEHARLTVDLQKEYVRAGSKAIYTGTFGANRLKLAAYNLGDRTVAINEALAQLAREAAGSACLVAGDLSTTGEFIKPIGELPFETAVNIYKEQVRGLLSGGVDFFVIETIFDLQDARAALLAVRESCDLPVCVSMTFTEELLTLTGTDPVTALITLESLGADAVGCNCSTGPETMIKIITAMSRYAQRPLLAKPNAELPHLVDGKTEFNMGPEEFARQAKLLVEAGAGLIGGCCGTSPEYIRAIVKLLGQTAPVKRVVEPFTAVTSSRRSVFIGNGYPVVIVGERINPAGKKQLQAELLMGKTTLVRKFAQEQMEQGAAILDINAGMPGIDEAATMLKLVELLGTTAEAPLCIDSASPEVIEQALRIYPGRALVNSISGETEKLERLLPVVTKYGAVVIALPIGDKGIPKTAAEREQIVVRIYERFSQFGYTKHDLVVDGLVMTISADPSAARECLSLIHWCSTDFGCNTIIGLSNISFGLPQRALLNGAFLAMAIGKGLTMAIANPTSELVMDLKTAADLLVAKDPNSRNYLLRFTNSKPVTDPPVQATSGKSNLLAELYNAVIYGYQEQIEELLQSALEAGTPAGVLVDNYLIPAINRVGELFEKKQYFLPQLIQSAATVKQAFQYLEPVLTNQNGGRGCNRRAKIVLATVKGDIHDIGKNLVALMLQNQGFVVYDLGKDVSAATIVNKAREIEADLIGLSALMTTTMPRMADVINLVKKEGINAKVIIGGAAVNEAYAREIGAAGYAADAYRAVKLAERLTNNNQN